MPRKHPVGAASCLPAFTDDPVDRLRHTVAAHTDTPADEWAVTATTGGAYPGHERTGLTHRDLWLLLDRLTGGDQRGPWAHRGQDLADMIEAYAAQVEQSTHGPLQAVAELRWILAGEHDPRTDGEL